MTEPQNKKRMLLCSHCYADVNNDGNKKRCSVVKLILCCCWQRKKVEWVSLNMQMGEVLQSWCLFIQTESICRHSRNSELGKRSSLIRTVAASDRSMPDEECVASSPAGNQRAAARSKWTGCVYWAELLGLFRHLGGEKKSNKGVRPRSFDINNNRMKLCNY